MTRLISQAKFRKSLTTHRKHNQCGEEGKDQGIQQTILDDDPASLGFDLVTPDRRADLPVWPQPEQSACTIENCYQHIATCFNGMSTHTVTCRIQESSMV